LGVFLAGLQKNIGITIRKEGGEKKVQEPGGKARGGSVARGKRARPTGGRKGFFSGPDSGTRGTGVGANVAPQQLVRKSNLSGPKKIRGASVPLGGGNGKQNRKKKREKKKKKTQNRGFFFPKKKKTQEGGGPPDGGAGGTGGPGGGGGGDGFFFGGPGGNKNTSKKKRADGVHCGIMCLNPGGAKRDRGQKKKGGGTGHIFIFRKRRTGGAGGNNGPA